MLARVGFALNCAGRFNVSVAIAKTERDLAAEEFYEQRMVYTPDSVKYLYIPKTSLKKGEHVLIVDDLIRSGVTLDALVRLAEPGEEIRFRRQVKPRARQGDGPEQEEAAEWD